jgi:3-deoxy-D-manno-octulosonic-acid transferase
MRLLYVAIAYLLAPVVLAAQAMRGFRDRSHWEGFSQRFGLGAEVQGRSIWVHAVSVGEVQAAAPLVNSLRQKFPDVPLVVTTGTATGRARARALFKGVDVRYVPIDLPGSVRRFFARVKPRLAVILETEIWPNLYHRCGRLEIPLVMASARISPRSVERYRRLVGLFRQALSHGIFIAAQSEQDAERFRSIGASPDRTHVVGNIKFDFRLPQNIESATRRSRVGCSVNSTSRLMPSFGNVVKRLSPTPPIMQSFETRAGCSTASRDATMPPSELPINPALSRPRASMNCRGACTAASIGWPCMGGLRP